MKSPYRVDMVCHSERPRCPVSGRPSGCGIWIEGSDRSVDKCANILSGAMIGGHLEQRLAPLRLCLGGLFSLRLHQAGIIKSNPNQIIANGTDWRFFNEIKRELKI